MRLLGIDYGIKRVGIAVSDPLMMTASPIAVIDNNKNVFEEIKELVEKYEVVRIVIGLPISLSGEAGPAVERVRAFAKSLKARTGIEVVEYDERLTTAAAEKAMIAADVKREKRKSVIDKIAAAYMLDDYMKAAAKRR